MHCACRTWNCWMLILMVLVVNVRLYIVKVLRSNLKLEIENLKGFTYDIPYVNIPINEWILTYSALQAGFLLKSTKLFRSANPGLSRLYLREHSRQFVHDNPELPILHTLKQDAMIGVFVSSRHVASSGCGFGRRSLVLEGSCKVIEETDVKGRHRVTLQVMNFREVLQVPQNKH
jgi:hypothetical protein